MTRKFRLYEKYGVEEYYIYDPEDVRLTGWVRSGEGLEEIPEIDGWISPRLGVRFVLAGGELRLIGPDNRPFATYRELARERDEAVRLAERLAARLKELGEDLP